MAALLAQFSFVATGQLMSLRTGEEAQRTPVSFKAKFTLESGDAIWSTHLGTVPQGKSLVITFVSVSERVEADKRISSISLGGTSEDANLRFFSGNDQQRQGFARETLVIFR